jgi:cytosine permease
VTQTNDFERPPVPLNHRRSWFSFVVVYLAVGIDLSAIVLGTELGQGLPLVDSRSVPAEVSLWNR